MQTRFPEAHKRSGERPGATDVVYCPWTCRTEVLVRQGEERICNGCVRTVDTEIVFEEGAAR